MQTKHKNYLERTTERLSFPVAAGVVMLKGTFACLNASGKAVPGAEASDLICVGIVENGADNTNGADGATNVDVRRDRHYPFEIDPLDPVTLADFGKTVFMADNNTVSKTDNGGARSEAGILRGVDDATAWIEFK